MSLFRQGSQYIAIGLLQLLLDWLVFVAATAVGLPAAPGNLLGRVSGALLGFWLNGRYTFADGNGQRLGWRRFTRFWLLWLAITAISTIKDATAIMMLEPPFSTIEIREKWSNTLHFRHLCDI